MESIKMQREIINNEIATAEQSILTLKDFIKESKSKLKKLDKFEKEFNAIFGIEVPENVTEEPDELPGQTVMEFAA